MKAVLKPNMLIRRISKEEFTGLIFRLKKNRFVKLIKKAGTNGLRPVKINGNGFLKKNRNEDEPEMCEVHICRCIIN